MKHVETARALLNEIFDERWKVGDRLPPERELAKQLSVSRITVRSALHRLTQKGYVQPRRGSGTYVLRKPETDPEPLSTPPARPLNARARTRLVQGKRVVVQRRYRFAYLHDRKENDLVGLSILAGAAAYTQRRCHEMMIGPSRQVTTDGHEVLADGVLNPRVDGIILSLTLLPGDLPKLKSIPVPIVLLRCGDPFPAVCNSVSIDAVSACREAVRELARAGHRRIAILEKQYIEALPALSHECHYLRQQLGLPEIHHFFGDDPLERIADGDRPTAFYVSDDVYCVEVCRKLSQRGIETGRDVVLISHANRGIERGLPPSVGRMEFDTPGWGRMAADLLETLLDEGLKELPPIILGARYIPARTP